MRCPASSPAVQPRSDTPAGRAFDRGGYPVVLGTRLQRRRKLAKRLALESNGLAGREPDRRQRARLRQTRRSGAAISEAAQKGLKIPSITYRGWS